MPKFYVSSGDVSMTVEACDAEGAALWVMNRKFGQYWELDGTNWGELTPRAVNAILDVLAGFGDWICVSQIGLGRDESARLKTMEVYRHLRQLQNAVNVLLKKISCG